MSRAPLTITVRVLCWDNFFGFAWSDENRNNLNVSEMAPDHPKRCSSIGGPWKNGFRAEFPSFSKTQLGLSFFPARGLVLESFLGVSEGRGDTALSLQFPAAFAGFLR